jgi:hypothetical protein
MGVEKAQSVFALSADCRFRKRRGQQEHQQPPAAEADSQPYLNSMFSIQGLSRTSRCQPARRQLRFDLDLFDVRMTDGIDDPSRRVAPLEPRGKLPDKGDIPALVQMRIN